MNQSFGKLSFLAAGLLELSPSALLSSERQWFFILDLLLLQQQLSYLRHLAHPWSILTSSQLRGP